MNKRYLKSYFGSMNERTMEKLKDKCFKSGENYLISNVYSIIVLKNNYDMEIFDDNLCLNNFVNNFENNFNIDLIDKTITNEMLQCEHYTIKDNYSINIKEFKKIVNLIKADSYNIYENLQQHMKYIIKIKNTKTGEYGYLLPQIII